MARGCKRMRPRDGRPNDMVKRMRGEAESARPAPSSNLHNHPALNLYYEGALPLRQFLLAHLPKRARNRRRKILRVGNDHKQGVAIALNQDAQHDMVNVERKGENGKRKTERIRQLLDETVVGIPRGFELFSAQHKAKHYSVFLRQAGNFEHPEEPQSPFSLCNLICFVIWLLFHRVHHESLWPPHMLCHGFKRAAMVYATKAQETSKSMAAEDIFDPGEIPGVEFRQHNDHVSRLANQTWRDVFALLGGDCDGILLSMLLHCGIFTRLGPTNTGNHPFEARDNLMQISGPPLSALSPLIPSVPASCSKSTNILSATSRPVTKREAEIKAITQHETLGPRTLCQTHRESVRTLASINFVRNRMFYARATINAKGRVSLGLRRIHALSRYKEVNNQQHLVRLLKYIFPRQFHLHNVFTSDVDATRTSQKFQDYTLREQELAGELEQLTKRYSRQSDAVRQKKANHIPSRLRGQCLVLVRMIQARHNSLSYSKLLHYYCPIMPTDSIKDLHRGSWPRNTDSMVNSHAQTCLQDIVNQPQHMRSKVEKVSSIAAPSKSLTDLATPSHHVSAFCQAVIRRLIPRSMWGAREEGVANRQTVMKNIDHFIKLRRFETLSLHSVMHGIKINAIHWLGPGADNIRKHALSDSRKRSEILAEFIYYVFDSLVIPLVRANFHVTEANSHQNRLFYFRHDIWRRATEPAVDRLRRDMFEEMRLSTATHLLESRPLGFSQMRLLPKSEGLRPIMNLSRRAVNGAIGQAALGRSINSVMRPVFNVLDMARKHQGSEYGGTTLSIWAMFGQLRSFRQRLVLDRIRDPPLLAQKVFDTEKHNMTPAMPLYFAKCDVNACFDTIPQDKVLELMQEMMTEEQYRIRRHAEIRSDRSVPLTTDMRGFNSQSRPLRKFVSVARPVDDCGNFDEFLSRNVALADKRGTVFVDNVVSRVEQRQQLLGLLEQHVRYNLVKIGKKFYRQKRGIPQGSILSSLLCNLFYADLERKHLSFLQPESSLLLRFIDDFLLITTNKAHAIRFMEIMNAGISEYGLSTSPAKSLTNFVFPGSSLPAACPTVKTPLFPFCGLTIHTTTLAISRDRERRKAGVVAETLTVEYARRPFQSFSRKMQSAYKIQSQIMLMDTRYNSITVVLQTIYLNMVDVAMKFCRYLISWAQYRGEVGRRLHSLDRTDKLMGIIDSLIGLAHCLGQARHKSSATDNYQFTITKDQIAWFVPSLLNLVFYPSYRFWLHELTHQAFRRVLQRKQTRFRDLMTYLDSAQIRDTKTLKVKASNSKSLYVDQVRRLNRIIEQSDSVFRDYDF